MFAAFYSTPPHHVSHVCCYRLVELTGDVAPDMKAVARADVIITTPEKWDGISRSWNTRGYVRKVSLIIIDEIHLLGKRRVEASFPIHAAVSSCCGVKMSASEKL